MELKPGSRWASATCEVEVVVVRAPSDPVSLECGGLAMVPTGDATANGTPPHPEFAGGTQIGKRYADEASGIEILATKAGLGTLAVGGLALPQKEAKPLPSSD
ncbi:MAG TPA: hypothetical protein VGL48_14045 [Acidimicrobiales bacterium]